MIESKPKPQKMDKNAIDLVSKQIYEKLRQTPVVFRQENINIGGFLPIKIRNNDQVTIRESIARKALGEFGLTQERCDEIALALVQSYQSAGAEKLGLVASEDALRPLVKDLMRSGGSLLDKVIVYQDYRLIGKLINRLLVNMSRNRQDLFRNCVMDWTRGEGHDLLHTPTKWTQCVKLACKHVIATFPEITKEQCEDALIRASVRPIQMTGQGRYTLPPNRDEAWVRSQIHMVHPEASERVAQAERRKWERYLQAKNSNPELTEHAWRGLGEEGDPPRIGFWMPMDADLPLFSHKGLTTARGVSIVSRLGISKAPVGVEPVARYSSPYGVSNVYRIADVEAVRRPEPVNAMKRSGTPIGGNTSGAAELSPILIPMTAPRVRDVHIHCGPTNSGKTWVSLNKLSQAAAGAYLAPLRLLAWEAYEYLNDMGCPTELLTGEEQIAMEGARIVAATVEMFPSKPYDVLVVDEAHLVGDLDRGWAWLRALITADAAELHVCCAPHGLSYLERLFGTLGDRITIHRYDRLLPLTPFNDAIALSDLPQRSAVIAFSRLDVLRIKAEIERIHRVPCAAIYGALPPDVRREQARRVRSGEAPFVAATDAIGMGINFPVDNVFLFSSTKFDGRTERPLYPEEVRQIVGRAGRFGLSSGGHFGALSKSAHKTVLSLAATVPQEIKWAYLQPTAAQLAQIPGRLAQRLTRWRELAMPERTDMIKVGSIRQQLELASLIPPKLERKLMRNIDLAFTLITAPVSRDTQPYWLRIVYAVTDGTPIPAPPSAPTAIRNDDDLESAERALKERELFLWLMRRRFHSSVAPDTVRVERDHLARLINKALAEGKVSGACRSCGEPVAPGFRHRICDKCHRSSYFEDDF